MGNLEEEKRVRVGLYPLSGSFLRNRTLRTQSRVALGLLALESFATNSTPH